MDFIVLELEFEQLIIAFDLFIGIIVSILVSGLRKFSKDFSFHVLFLKILFLRVVYNILIPLNGEICHFLYIFVLT